MYISFVASPLMKYVFFASLNEINGIFIPKIEFSFYSKNLNILYVLLYPKLRKLLQNMSSAIVIKSALRVIL